MGAAAPASLLVGLSLAVWLPAIAGNRILLDGDSILHGLPLFALLASFLRGHAALAWSPAVYGGHPLFAEGQGEFAEPLNLLVAGLVPLIGLVRALDLLHLTTMGLTALGVLGLCRELGLSGWAGCFASLACVFSPLELGCEHNLTISGSLTWAPYAMWAAQCWRRCPTAAAGVALGTAFAASVLAGYPQTTHAAALYALLAGAGGVSDWRRTWRKRLRSGLLAVAVGIGLSAVQWLPLAQLVALSIRHSGIGLVRAFHLPARSYLAGALFSGVPDPNLGSLLVCLLSAAGIVLARGRAMTAHLVASALLCLLGIERATPIFGLLYDHRLIPGLHAFRTTVVWLLVGLIGLACVAGYGIDRLAARRPSRFLKLAAVGSLAPCLGLTVLVRPAHGGFVELVSVLIATVALLVGRREWLPPVLAFTLALECVTVRFDRFAFFSDQFLDTPASVRTVRSLPDWRDYKTADDTIASAYVFLAASDPRFAHFYEAMREAQSGMTALLDGTRSIEGALALELSRRAILDPVLDAEMHCADAGRAGLRLIDILGVRTFGATDPRTCGSLLPLGGPVHAVWTILNRAAKPQVQLYARDVAVGTPAAALAVLRRTTAPVLVIEDPDGRARRLETASLRTATPGTAVMTKDRATLRRVRVSTPAPVWLFLADAYYPGWRATIDGRSTRIFPAQVLGKAVEVPAGSHLVVFRFTSRPLAAGLALSLTTLVSLAFAGAINSLERETSRRSRLVGRLCSGQAHRARLNQTREARDERRTDVGSTGWFSAGPIA